MPRPPGADQSPMSRPLLSAILDPYAAPVSRATLMALPTVAHRHRPG